MKIIKFDKTLGKQINNSDTQFTAIRIINEAEVKVGYMYFDKGNKVSFHEAFVDQLFVIIEGEGWVAGNDRKKIKLIKEEGVFWETGEWHEAGTDSGMKVLCIEGKNLDKNNLPILNISDNL